jgi:hypothetical protein
MGDKAWRASSDGPDWMDVISTLKAVEGLHGVTVTIGLHSVPGYGLVSMWHLTAVQADRDASVLGNSVMDLSGEYPCKDHSRVEHCLYAGLLRLDHELTKRYRQEYLKGPTGSELPA